MAAYTKIKLTRLKRKLVMNQVKSMLKSTCRFS